MGGNKTGIAWADLSYQITEGCMHAGSPACDHCYAEEFAGRFAEEGQPFHGLVQIRANGHARWTGLFRERPDRLAAMIGWRGGGESKGPGSRLRVFIGSMTDTFKEEVSDLFLAAAYAVFGAMGDTHIFQLLTKRPHRALAFFQWLRKETGGYEPKRLTTVLLNAAEQVLGPKARKKIEARLLRWRTEVAYPRFPFDNVHLGSTVENQQTAMLRIPYLLQCDAALYWLSMEPLFEAVDIGLCAVSCSCGSKCDLHRGKGRWVRLRHAVHADDLGIPLLKAMGGPPAAPGIYLAKSNAHGALAVERPGVSGLLGIKPGEFEFLPQIGWVVAGLESGGRARDGEVEHMEHVQAQCKVAGVPYFGKQLGTRPRYRGQPLKLRHSHGAWMEEWPEHLRVREWPR
ncbi:MAG TPA: DUF5131 family protein [Gemmatimonadales bacterium]|nr:DUF5131 family protein [Gemmatimonadales bacterium]